MLYVLRSVEESRALALAVMETVPEPLAAVDERFCLMTASQSFYNLFGLGRALSEGRPIYALGDGRLDTPEVRVFLSMVACDDLATPDSIEVEQPVVGGRAQVMALSARRMRHGADDQSIIILSFRDITDRRALERDKTNLLLQTSRRLRDKDILLREVQHRIGNNIQMLAALLRVQAGSAPSEEVRYHLQDAYLRMQSVGRVQSHLHDTENSDVIEVSSYLSDLASGLGDSMVSERQPIRIEARSARGTIPSTLAVRLGLVVTELVINATKFAFPAPKADAEIFVDYEAQGAGWKLVVSDNGVGNGAGEGGRNRGPLARTIVNGLVRQLDARMIVSSGPEGLAVSIMSPTYMTQ